MRGFLELLPLVLLRVQGLAALLLEPEPHERGLLRFVGPVLGAPLALVRLRLHLRLDLGRQRLGCFAGSCLPRQRRALVRRPRSVRAWELAPARPLAQRSWRRLIALETQPP